MSWSSGQSGRNRGTGAGDAHGHSDFGGITKRICLSYVPDVSVGEYVIVHVGFAISKVDEQEARQVFAYLREMDDLKELGIPQPD